jgi:hypothetical protein
VGTTTSGFSFESLSAPAPGVFRSFEAFEFDGDFLTGDVQTTIIPEPITLVGVAGVCGIYAMLSAGGVTRRDAQRRRPCVAVQVRGAA